MTLHRPSFVSTAVRCAIALAVSALGVSAEAGHRARLSRDLADRIAASRTDPVRVIVSGNDAEVSEIARRHGARVAKRLRGAAVLEVPGAALDAMTQDPAVSHLSGDVPVRRLMAVTTEAIGADQVWRGALAGLEGRTGTGIGVAVIDSGIASHQRPAGPGRGVGGLHRPQRLRARSSTGTARTWRESSPARPTPGMPAWRRARTSSTCRS